MWGALSTASVCLALACHRERTGPGIGRSRDAAKRNNTVNKGPEWKPNRIATYWPCSPSRHSARLQHERSRLTPTVCPLRPTSLPPARPLRAAKQPDEIVVFGRNLELLGTAEAASEGSVGGADLLVRPMLKVAELLESVPGLVAVQHSGSGKANQYFLRGFNLDHGTDFTAVVDGMPWNLRSHGHGQGYLDINGMMPEVVERIDYRKGPYRADLGDFSMAGAAFITTIDRLDQPFVALEGGDYGWRRLAGGGTLELDNDANAHGHGRAHGVRRAVGAAREPEPHGGLGQVLAAHRLRSARDHGVGLSRDVDPDRADSRACDRHVRVRERVLRARSDLDRGDGSPGSRRPCSMATSGALRRTRSTTTGRCSPTRPTTFS